MKKKKLWKDIKKCFINSKGRFISIFCLMMLGSFALVGLKVTGPNMRETGTHYFEDLNLSDLTVIGDYGIDSTNQKAINQLSGTKKIEYGYLKDVEIKNTTDSIRLFSNPNTISKYELTEGEDAKNENEIVLSDTYKDQYDIGDTIKVTEKESLGTKVLKKHSFKIVGFAKSAEFVSSINMGQSTSGSGELKGYGFVSSEVFDSDFYMIARMTFQDTENVDPYSDEYTDLIQAHKNELDELLEDQPQLRLQALKEEYQDNIDDGQQQIDEAKQKLTDTREQLNDAGEQIEEAKTTIASSDSQLKSAKQQLASGKTTLAEKEIAENEEKLEDAKEEMNNLETPVYSLSTRREAPGADGYKIYNTISTIIDALANVFPIFLYFVAALVTLTTMTRFVDEERVNAGTLKALGYTDRDVMKKFTVYGLIAGVSGTIAGILLGHLLLPEIVYNAYKSGFDVPAIERHFYVKTSLAALVLSILSAVLPAYVVGLRELREKPAALLLPKAPTKGSKIFLEPLKPIWSKMSFTHKVTARNIFRYKKRMFMTIFGVCGAVALLFTGFSVQNSISKINDRQFGELIKYDLIVAQNSHLSEEEQQDLDSLLSSEAIKQQLPIHYESVSKVAGAKKDDQEIKMIVTQDEEKFREYFTLTNRRDKKEIDLDNDGVVISERLAKLLDVKAGDRFTITDSNDKEHEVEVAAITEMYTGHFMFMTDSYYETAFSENYQANANLVSLNDRSTDNAKQQASRFMELSGVKGVVQNTTMITQINTIVDSLNQIMEVLILVAVLLAIVILYNLTNINVAERIRELSTIKVLGFYDKEVTLYIYRETILLSLLGILAGFGVGDILFRYILAVVPPDEVMFNPALGVKAFAVPAIFIAVITFILGCMMNRKLRHLDMLSALKSVE